MDFSIDCLIKTFNVYHGINALFTIDFYSYPL